MARQAAEPSRLPQLRYVDPYKRRGLVYRAVCRLAVTKVGMWLSQKIAWKLDPYLLAATGGRFSTTAPLASAVLETRGARTGRLQRTAVLYFHDGDCVTIIASKRGLPANPAWYHNLRAHPEVTLGGLPFRACVVDDEVERQRLWELGDRVFSPFADYRRWATTAGRVIPIIRLTAPRHTHGRGARVRL